MGAARAAESPVRSLTPSLLNTLVRCPSTVREVTNRVWAISRLVSPSAASSAMRSSLAVSDSRPMSSTRRGLAPVARQFGLRPSGQRGGAEVMGGVDGTPEQLASLNAAVGAAEQGAQVGLGAGLFEAGVRTGEHLDGLA